MVVVHCACAVPAFLAMLALLVQFVRADLPLACGTDTKGVQVGPPIYLIEVDMAPGIRDWHLTLPANVCGSPYKFVVGMTVTPCDYDLPPQVTVYDDLIHALIHRTGDLSQMGKIYTAVYCAGAPYRRGTASAPDGGSQLPPAQEFEPAVLGRSVV